MRCIAAKQYWTNVSSDGRVTIPRVQAGTYRVTLYAEGNFILSKAKQLYLYLRVGIFGQFEQDEVVVSAGDGDGAEFRINWEAECHGG